MEKLNAYLIIFLLISSGQFLPNLANIINSSKGICGPGWRVFSPNGKYKIIVAGDKAQREKVDTTTLLCKDVKFCSYIDEYAFFKWIESIDCVDSFSQVNNELYLEIACLDLHDDDLRELLALLHRYNIDMKQLSAFLNEDNKEWFYGEPKGYWHKKVFGEMTK